jgi:chromosome partitioning protein
MQIENPSDFEKVVAAFFARMGYEADLARKNARGLDIELKKGKQRIAVQAKNYSSGYKISIPMLQKFLKFLELSANEYQEGWFITSSTFARPVLALVQSEQIKNLRLGVFSLKPEGVTWFYPTEETWPASLQAGGSPIPPPELPRLEKRKYIGVFTCKGGVGKTTVAAHLAGAFALTGYNIALVDLDPDANLRKLFQDPCDPETAGLYVETPRKNEVGSVISVFNIDQWHDIKDEEIVICDCSPVLSQNPQKVVSLFDYCIIPTTLNPLGVNKNADVIIRTFEHIRSINKNTEMFLLINNLKNGKDFQDRNIKLFQMLKSSLQNYLDKDKKCKIIYPSIVSIRNSRQLEYWGYHIVDNAPPTLAFNKFGGRCFPREDFLKLANYLENATDIEEFFIKKTQEEKAQKK